MHPPRPRSLLPLYEQPPSGPRIKVEDFARALAALHAVAWVACRVAEACPADQLASEEREVKRLLRAYSGRQWTLLTAFQYLTGQRADKALRAWPDDFAAHGFAPSIAQALVDLANDFCANVHPEHAMSAGLLVEWYRNRQGGSSHPVDRLP